MSSGSAARSLGSGSGARRGGQAPDQASTGARPAPPCTRGRIIRKARNQRGQSPDESHATRRTPGWRRPQTDRPAESHSPLTSRGLTRSAVLPDWVVTSVGCDSGLQGQGCRRTRLASRHCRDTSPRARRTSVRADCSHEPRESPRQSRPGLGEMTNEEVGGSIRYGVGVDAEEHVIGSFDPLHLAGSTDCLQRLMHQCALFRR
jgi:hypothetical protein